MVLTAAAAHRLSSHTESDSFRRVSASVARSFLITHDKFRKISISISPCIYNYTGEDDFCQALKKELAFDAPRSQSTTPEALQDNTTNQQRNRGEQCSRHNQVIDRLTGAGVGGGHIPTL